MLWDLLLALAVVALVGSVAAAVAFGLLVRAVAARARLHPTIETGAPLQWLVSPAAPARLHRRLRATLGPIADQPDVVDLRCGGTGLASSLIGEATALDRHLVLVARQPRSVRRARLRQVRREVRQFERATGRLHHVLLDDGRTAPPWPAAGPVPATGSTVLDAVHQRLDLLAEAHAELRAIERAETGTDPDEVLRRISPRSTLAVPAATHPGRALPSAPSR